MNPKLLAIKASVKFSLALLHETTNLGSYRILCHARASAKNAVSKAQEGATVKHLYVIGPLLIAGCASEPPANQFVGMANPASVYCQEQGGRLEIRNGPDGQSGYCRLPDGRVVDEWELFRSQRQNDGR